MSWGVDKLLAAMEQRPDVAVMRAKYEIGDISEEQYTQWLRDEKAKLSTQQGQKKRNTSSSSSNREARDPDHIRILKLKKKHSGINSMSDKDILELFHGENVDGINLDSDW